MSIDTSTKDELKDVTNHHKPQQDISNATDHDVDSSHDGGRNHGPSKWKRLAGKLLFCSYVIGIVWTCLHPIVSVLTGEMKCRGWYLDEHSIEIKFAESSSLWETPSHLKLSSPPPVQPQQRHSNLCQGINDWWKKSIPSNLLCHIHGDYFSMVQITPLANAIDPMEEALVFVIPSTTDWTTTTFHRTLLTSLERLVDPIKTPWLAKTLILVAPNNNNNHSNVNDNDHNQSSTTPSLDATVSAFLDAYMGSPSIESYVDDSSSYSSFYSSVPLLPPKYSQALLRSLVVLDIDDQSDKQTVARGNMNKELLGRTNFQILPQGQRGVLPNLDLVFLVGKLFSKAMYLSKQKFPHTTSFLSHPYTETSQHLKDYVMKDLPQQLPFLGPFNQQTQRWANDLIDMGLFAYTMAMGPYPPHAVALNRGIDSITIQIQFQGMYYRDPAIETIQYWEYLVRALSNLHERLHHSYSLYWLPTPRTFVSHMEYFLPNLLILLPLAIRGFGLVLWEVQRLDLTIMGLALLTTTTSVALSSMAFHMTSNGDTSMANTWLVCLYAAIIAVWKAFVLSTSTKTSNCDDDTATTAAAATSIQKRRLQSLQVMACVVAAHNLSPIVFAHTALSYVPSLLWTPLLAFPNYGELSKAGKAVCLITVVVTAPPILLVPRILNSYTPFAQFVYIPLHIQLLLTVMTSLL